MQSHVACAQTIEQFELNMAEIITGILVGSQQQGGVKKILLEIEKSVVLKSR